MFGVAGKSTVESLPSQEHTNNPVPKEEDDNDNNVPSLHLIYLL